jgi:hypothetical protein
MAAYCIKECSQIQDIVACWLKKRFLRIRASGNMRGALLEPVSRRSEGLAPKPKRLQDLVWGFNPGTGVLTFRDLGRGVGSSAQRAMKTYPGLHGAKLWNVREVQCPSGQQISPKTAGLVGSGILRLVVRMVIVRRGRLSPLW